MTTAGIVAEYNPFHLGHRHQLTALRALLGQHCAVVAVMSGNFVQRGDFALLPKHLRAEMALRCGVDLVLELPTVYAMATAETFARGAVGILQAAGVVTHLCFGSESGNLEELQAAAACLDGADYREALQKELRRGLSFASARQRAAEAVCGWPLPCLEGPNNNLGIEYLRALRREKSPILPITVRRLGAAHDSREPSAETASASLIRRLALAGKNAGVWMPEEAAAVLDRAAGAGLAPASRDRCERALLAVLRRMEEEAFRPYDGGSEGLYHRFYQAVGRAETTEALLENCKTRRYAMSRLRRMMMAAYLGLEPPPPSPPFLRVLGATERGRDLLRRMKKEAALPVLTKAAGVRKLGREAEAFLRRESRYTDLYALACPVPPPPGMEFVTDPVMLS